MCILNGEDGLESEFHVNGMQLKHVLKGKCLGYVLDELGADEAECHRKVASGRKFAGFTAECAKVLHETSLMPVLMYGSETMIWKEKEKFRAV